ncbi:hypothetical protein Tco_0561334 [Tanacetum coccineum]
MGNAIAIQLESRRFPSRGQAGKFQIKRAPRNQENRGRENNRRTVIVETPTKNDLVAQDGIRGLVMKRFEDNTPEGYNLLLWGDLKLKHVIRAQLTSHHSRKCLQKIVNWKLETEAESTMHLSFSSLSITRIKEKKGRIVGNYGLTPSVAVQLENWLVMLVP